ncbi:cell envelope integrity EipB family protein [Hyphomicrobium sp.]|uniref:cell envelope integrity EipB family protein n=1 Tax=Hyphomicrobium sp. TaxID=82 RepID=UPI002FDE857F
MRRRTYGPMSVVVAAAALGLLVPSVLSWPEGPARATPALKDVVFVPHRAVYDLSLDNAQSGSGVASVNGRIVYELSGNACEGYAQSMRFVTQTLNQEGDMQTTDLRTSSWEEVPARRLRFSTSTYQNEQQAEQTQGVAKRAQGKGAITVDLARPDKREVKLSGDIYFPIQHSMAIIQAARAGRTIFAADLYDGSETGDKIYATSTAIGRQMKPGTGAVVSLAKGKADLDRVPSWPISVSYFPVDQQRGDTVPLYEMSYRFHDNGVTSSLRINHGDFAIVGELKELTYFEPSPCKNPTP